MDNLFLQKHFHPVRITTTDGKQYEILHPELIWFDGVFVVIAVPWLNDFSLIWENINNIFRVEEIRDEVS